MKSRRWLMTALALLAAGAQARQPDVDGIRHWSTPAFDLYSPDVSQARTVAEEVAPIELVLSMIMGKKVQATGVPTTIYIAPQSVWHRYLRPSPSIVAEFVPGRFANYILMELYLDEVGARHTLKHEYSHYFLRTQFGGVLPLWFDEGVAEIASATQMLTKKARIGLPPFGGGTWLPLEKLLRADKQSPEYLSYETTHAFHFQSWALVHWGLFEDRAFGQQIFAYLRAINAGKPIEDAVQASFGMDVAALDRALAGYTKRRAYRIGKFPVEWPAKVKLGDGRRVGELEALEQLARIMFDTGLNPSRLGEVIEAARELAPESASVRVLALRLAARDGKDADVESAWRALEPQAAEPAVARAAALALFSRIRAEISGELPAGQGLTAQARRAFDLLARSEHALPVDAEGAWAFGMLSAHLGLDAEFALQRLQLAAASVPNNGDLARAQALVHERLGQRDQMREQLLNTQRHSRTASQIQWAAQKISSLEGSIGKSEVTQ